MNDAAAVDAALRAAGHSPEVHDLRPLSGGCIHRVMEVSRRSGENVVAKLNSPDQIALFEEEAAGLRALAATGTVIVPVPLNVGVFEGQAILVMTALRPQPPNDEAWVRFGRDLAALHQCAAGDRYGFKTDNHLGSTPQPNTFCDDWVEFNQRCRLGHQLHLAQRRSLLTEKEQLRVSTLIGRLDEHIPRRPRPSLLHGDLWSGNALPSVDERGDSRIAVIDPACSIGDGYADIAMMRLFGGFPESCYAAYFEGIRDDDRRESRLAVYQLYHLLNHLNLFGRGYAGQVMGTVNRLVG